MIVLMLFALILLIVLGMPIAYALGMVSFLYLSTKGIALSMMAQSLVRGINSFTILAIPFFFLAGELMNASGVTERIIKLAQALVGHITGGLAQVNILASVMFAGLSGSATADTAALGSILIPSMVKEGYDKDFSAAITVASSMVGPIIPPSITLVLYGIMAQQPIGQLLIAGILPGFIVAGTQMVYTYFYSKKMEYPRYPRASLREFGGAMREGVPAVIMPLIIVGGILSGVFTPTEAAAVAVLYGFIVGLFFFKQFNLHGMWQMIKGVGLRSIRVLIVLAYATLFGWIVTRARIPEMVVDFLFSLSSNPSVLLFLIIMFLLVVGLFMLPSPALVVLTPILAPVASKIGISPIHFGVIMVLTLTVGSATPPVGVCLYIASDIAEMPVQRLIKAMIPLYIVLFAAILIIAYVPAISMYLPTTLL